MKETSLMCLDEGDKFVFVNGFPINERDVYVKCERWGGLQSYETIVVDIEEGYIEVVNSDTKVLKVQTKDFSTEKENEEILKKLAKIDKTVTDLSYSFDYYRRR